MATLTIPNSFTGLTTIRSADMNANFQAVATFLNSTKLDGTNLQTAVADASTIELASNVLRVKDAGITRTKIAAVGQQVSGAVTLTPALTTSFADLTGLSISITTTGRPVWVGLVSDGNGTNPSYVGTNNTDVTVNNSASIILLRGATEVSRVNYQPLYDVSGGSPPLSWSGYYPPGTFWHIDVPAAGTYTYKLQAKKAGSGSTVNLSVAACKLIAYEIG